MDLRVQDVPELYEDAANYLSASLYPYHNKVYINVNKLMSYYTWASSLSERLAEDLNDILFEDFGATRWYNPNSPAKMKEVIIDRYGVPEEQLYNYQGKVSTGSDVLNNLSGKYKNKFIRTLIEYRKQNAIVTNLQQFIPYIDGAPRELNNEGDEIISLHTLYSKLNTNRFQTINPSFQSLSREESDIITAPEGYVVLQADSGQIEPRLYYSWTVKDPMMDWLIEKYGDVYYAIADYCLRDNISLSEDNMFQIGTITRLERDAFKTLTNAGAYGAGKKRIKNKASEIVFQQFERENREDAKILRQIMKYKTALERPTLPPHIRNDYNEKYLKAVAILEALNQRINLLYDRFQERVIQHPQRVAFLQREEAKIYGNNRTLKTVFGDEILVYGNRSYLLNCAINNPLQGAVARLSSLSTVMAFQYVEKNNLEGKVIYSLNKHDQDVYVVKADIVEKVAPYLTSLRAYNIEGAHPIESDSSYNLNYAK